MVQRKAAGLTTGSASLAVSQRQTVLGGLHGTLGS